MEFDPSAWRTLASDLSSKFRSTVSIGWRWAIVTATLAAKPLTCSGGSVLLGHRVSAALRYLHLIKLLGRSSWDSARSGLQEVSTCLRRFSADQPAMHILDLFEPGYAQRQKQRVEDSALCRRTRCLRT
jgi:hypothetical protein